MIGIDSRGTRDAYRRMLRNAFLCIAGTAAFIFVSPTRSARAARAVHATLLHAIPSANSTVHALPQTVMLVFSEEMVPDLSRIVLVGANGKHVVLQVSLDPRDVHTLIGRLNRIDVADLCASPCDQRLHVSWRVVSADGHPVAGSFTFTVEERAVGQLTASPTPSSIPAAVTGSTGDSLDTAGESRADSTPVVAAALRGIGLGALMACIGLLIFAGDGGERERAVAWRWSMRLSLIAAAALSTHLIVWVSRVAPDDPSGPALGQAITSRVGEIELVRTTLALLTLWAFGLARRHRLALVFGVGCLVASGVAGHPSAIASGWTVPAKIAHLLAGAIWLGGLLWLLAGATGNQIDFATQARRVSGAALISVVVIFASGLLQTFFFLNSPFDLFSTEYGLLVAAKIAGFLILLGFGAYNRFRLIPSILEQSAPRRLQRTVRAEVYLVIVLILIGGFLAYSPTPPVRETNSMERSKQ